MKRAYNDSKFILDDKNNIMGINLGYDFCTEHEIGIKELQEGFGLRIKEEVGFEARRNTIVPKQLIYQEGTSAVLAYSPYLVREDLEYLLKGNLSIYEDEELATAWSENSFGVNVIHKHKEFLKSLYEAFQHKNGIITLSVPKLLGNSGLILTDYTKISEEMKNKFIEKCKKSKEEQAMFRRLEQESGVYDLFNKAGKDFFYLRIDQLDENGQPLWWLNSSHKFGWYTTEQLRELVKIKD